LIHFSEFLKIIDQVLFIMSNTSKKRLSVLVHGMVQGVGFRYFVLRSAKNIGVTGWVKNLPDGSVAAIAEGEERNLETFLDILKKGPSFSHVSNVDIEWEEYKGSFKSFDVTF
jgi:acylphosphatase